MGWEVNYDYVRKDLDRLGYPDAQRIIKYLDNIIKLSNPRSKGKSLTGRLKDRWRYQVGKMRIVCNIKDDKYLIIVTDVGYRGDIYKKAR